MKKKYRVKKSSEIETILKNRKCHASNYFSIYLKDRVFEYERYALSFSKKLGNAVQRNKFKRWSREIVDSYLSNNTSKYDFFIIGKKNIINADFHTFKLELEKILRKGVRNE